MRGGKSKTIFSVSEECYYGLSQMLTERWVLLVIAYLLFFFHFVLLRHYVYTVKCTHLKFEFDDFLHIYTPIVVWVVSSQKICGRF